MSLPYLGMRKTIRTEYTIGAVTAELLDSKVERRRFQLHDCNNNNFDS
jgi:hypothetical protein